MNLQDIINLLDAEWATAKELNRQRSGDSYLEGYMAGLERAALLVSRSVQ